MYLVLVCALLKLFQLVVEDGELPGDALYSSMQTPVLTVLCIEIVFIPLPLLRGGDHRVLPRIENTTKYEQETSTNPKVFLKVSVEKKKSTGLMLCKC